MAEITEIQEKWFLKIGLVLVIAGVTAFGLNYFSLFVFKGIEVELFKERSFLYLPMILIGFFGIFFLSGGQKIVEKNPSKYAKNWGWMYAPFYSPKASILYKTKFTRWMVSSFWNQFLIGFILFSIVGLLGLTRNTFFAPISQQVLKGGEFILEIYPASPSETLFFLFFGFLIWGIIRWLIVYKKILGELGEDFAYGLSLILVPISIGLGWMAYHSWVYSTQETKLIQTFIFGSVGMFLTMLFFSIVLWWIWHDINNAIFSAKKVFDNDVGTITVWGIIAFIILIIFLLRFFTKKKK